MVPMQLPQWLARFNRYGKTVSYKAPRIMSKAEAAPSVTGLWRPLFARLPFEDVLLLTRG